MSTRSVVVVLGLIEPRHVYAPDLLQLPQQVDARPATFSLVLGFILMMVLDVSLG